MGAGPSVCGKCFSKTPTLSPNTSYENVRTISVKKIEEDDEWADQVLSVSAEDESLMESIDGKLEIVGVGYDKIHSDMREAAAPNPLQNEENTRLMEHTPSETKVCDDEEEDTGYNGVLGEINKLSSHIQEEKEGVDEEDTGETLDELVPLSGCIAPHNNPVKLSATKSSKAKSTSSFFSVFRRKKQNRRCTSEGIINRDANPTVANKTDDDKFENATEQQQVDPTDDRADNDHFVDATTDIHGPAGENDKRSSDIGGAHGDSADEVVADETKDKLKDVGSPMDSRVFGGIRDAVANGSPSNWVPNWMWG